ncbi:flagellar basal body rod protein FlgB [Acetobacterium fimetarium]|uniref:Flagellar basal body rod protein FlgB n=1 Tax=Acetobacterium fimetarium TaxID=52691 RepID=A0ABR6WWL8_9FIRM|nr:flagellar basal body rod protein FlgB [Acetobacterium fimetarium]MBC3804823.1 flagellar basal body rod protein FlgB [Acetobacterium fimetarium]
MIGDSITSALYEKALNGTWQRQKAISNNIANSETPGYKAVAVDFEDELKSEIQKIQTTSASAASKTKNIESIENSQVSVYSRSSSSRLDENNVDVDSENIDMTKAQLQYYYLVQGVSDSYSRLKYAISGGK